MLAVYVLAVLCWVSVSTSAPVDCGNLVQPLTQVDRHHVEGKWHLVAGSLVTQEFVERFKQRDSASITFANSSGTSNMTLTRIFRYGERCEYVTTNITLEDSSFALREMNMTATLLQTSCPDCAVVRFTKEKPMRLYLFSKRRQVEQKEMEEFETQTECLSMLPPAVMDPTKEMCSEEITPKPTDQTEEKPEEQKAS